MDEDLQRKRSRRSRGAGRRPVARPRLLIKRTLSCLHRSDVCQGVLPGQHDKIGAEFRGEGEACRARDGHLGGTVDRKIRRQGADQLADPDVLHDGRVDAGCDDAAQVVLGLGEFLGKDQRIEGHVAAHAALVEMRHELRQVTGGEILRAHPGIESLETEVDCVGSIFDRGLHAFPVARWRQDLRASRHGPA